MTTKQSHICFRRWAYLLLAAACIASASAAPAVKLFEDDFNRGIPGWTAVQPAGNYLDGPLRWQYDIVSGEFLEQSNIYTDAAAASPSATAAMLINDTVAGTNFTYKARLTAGDDDAFGLIFGYQNPTNFYRVTFTRQHRTDVGYPWNGWNVDRKINNVATNLFGDGTPDHVETFVNTQYQPFDVTISITGKNLFSLTVVDDPDGAATEYKLVDSQPLPGAANGKVGLVTWGMSGTLLRGFHIGNPTLAPLALAGNPNALTNWTPVVPPRADGSGLDAGGGNGGRPIWSLALGQNGAFGTLHENSDSLGGNDADGVVDFAAASIVAGDVTWSNYVMTARIIPADDDGHGILLRYQDELNFYRIALRNQSSATGVRKGLSIQKVVGGVWEEIYHDDPVKYDPIPNVPYDITALVIGNRLQIQVVGDPTGSPKTFSYGPFDITGPTVPTGKIGFFSWAMSRTEFDFVQVQGIDGIPLQVTSAYGNPEPPTGLNGYTPGAMVTASVTSPLEEFPGLRRVATGWTGQGSVPATGAGSTVTFTMNEISAITWNWRTEVKLAATAGTGGTVQAPSGDWLPEGTNVTVTAQPNAGFMFTGWSGDIASTERVLNLRLSRPYNIQALFAADSDNDGLPDSWEETYFGGLSATAGGDNDGDGVSNLAEYQRGTDPSHAEILGVSDGLNSRWENVQRDPALPGQLVVRDFGSGFRGIWENSNDYREAVDPTIIGAENVVPGVSFEGPRIVIKTNIWKPEWNDSTASVIFSVGDNDGNCLYFRYQDEKNWYRVTVCGENNNLDWRAPFGVTVQKRVNGVFTELAEDASIATDPTDVSFYKRVRITVNTQGPNIEVRVAGWNALVTPPAWDTGTELVLQLTDSDIPNGRIGVGTWGQSGGSTATPTNPVAAGALIEDVVITLNGQDVFHEDWEQSPLSSELPAGWTNPGTGTAAGTWQVTGHGSILQTANYSTATTGTLAQPKADGEGTILLAPAPGSSNYLLEIGFHPFDDDGIGFVYDYVDANNFSRVIFVSEPSNNGRIPQGVSISRKSGGVWSDIIAGDNSFVYTNGSPFAVRFANNNGEYRLAAWHVDNPGTVWSWAWTAPAATATNRFGLTCWGETDAHFLYARSYDLATRSAGGELSISSVALSSGSLVLQVSNPGGTAYTVESSQTLSPGSWTVVATGQTGTQWTVPLRTENGAVYYRLRRN